MQANDPELIKFKKQGGKALLKQAQIYAKQFISELDQCPTQYHAIEFSKKKLQDHGFVELHENQKWDLKANTGYYFSRNQSTLVSFVLPSHPPKKGVDLFKFMGTHSDVCQFRLAPISKLDN